MSISGRAPTPGSGGPSHSKWEQVQSYSRRTNSDFLLNAASRLVWLQGDLFMKVDVSDPHLTLPPNDFGRKFLQN